MSEQQLKDKMFKFVIEGYNSYIPEDKMFELKQGNDNIIGFIDGMFETYEDNYSGFQNEKPVILAPQEIFFTLMQRIWDHQRITVKELHSQIYSIDGVRIIFSDAVSRRLILTKFFNFALTINHNFNTFLVLRSERTIIGLLK